MKYPFLLIISLVNTLEMIGAYGEDENSFVSNLNDSELDENTGNAEFFINNDYNSLGRENYNNEESKLRQNDKRADDNENASIDKIDNEIKDLKVELEKKKLEHKTNLATLRDLQATNKKLGIDISILVKKMKGKEKEKKKVVTKTFQINKRRGKY
jgi:hypothetical protein